LSESQRVTLGSVGQPGWLEELGFEVRSIQPIIDMVPQSHVIWQWPKGFFDVGLRRLMDLGAVTMTRAEEIRQAFSACEAAANTLMSTPAVLEIIATRR
jgi:hypothetical protein